MNNFLDAFDMDSILDKSLVPHQFYLMDIIKIEDTSSDHILTNFQIYYM